MGLKGSRDGRVDLRDVARTAEQLVRQAAAGAGQQIEPAASRLIAERAGTDIGRLRGDVERLLLYHVRSTEDWHRGRAADRQRGDRAGRLGRHQRHPAARRRRRAAAGRAGAGFGWVSYQILGQLAWFVRERMIASDPRRVPAAIEALFRTDLELKNSGDARVLLERLVVDLCRG